MSCLKVDYVKNQQNEWTSKSLVAVERTDVFLTGMQKSMQDAVNENREMKHHEDDIVNELRGYETDGCVHSLIPRFHQKDNSSGEELSRIQRDGLITV